MPIPSFNEWKTGQPVAEKTTTPATTTPPVTGGVPSFSQWQQNASIPNVREASDKVTLGFNDSVFKTLLPGTSASFEEFLQDPFSVKNQDPLKIFKDYWDGVKSSFQSAGSTWKDVFKKEEGETGAEKTSDVLSGVTRGAGAVISPVTSLFTAAENIPVAGAAVKVFNGIFTALGDVGKDLAYPVVNAIPGLDKQQREHLVEGVGEVFALATQIAAGKISEGVGSRYLPSEKRATAFRDNVVKTYPELPVAEVKKIPSSKINSLIKQFGETDAQTIIRQAIEKATQIKLKKEIPVRSESGFNQVPISTPLTRAGDYARKQGYEPIVPSEKLPTIQMGEKGKPKPVTGPTVELGTAPNVYGKNKLKSEYEAYTPDSNLPSIGFDAQTAIRLAKEKITAPKTKSEPQLRVEYVKNKIIERAPKQRVVEKKQRVVEKKAKPVVEKVKEEIETTPGISKVATRVNRDAIETGMTEGFKDLAGYDPITIKDQARRASDLIEKDIESAKAAALGKEPLPDGLRPEALVVAMKEWLKKNPDPEFAIEFVKSPLLSETSAHAQALRILREQEPNSVVSMIKDLQDTRMKVAERRLKGKDIKKEKKNIASEIKKEIDKKKPSKQDWNDFINSIECK